MARSPASFTGLKPMFMWAGGKTRLIGPYTPLMPDRARISAYVEPFFGGGALFCEVRERFPGLPASINDVNDEIMRLYQAVRDDAPALHAHMDRWAATYLPLPKDKRKAFYYGQRAAYWTLPQGLEDSALLYFLLKTCFNGIWQSCKAANGKFGTPVGLANQTPERGIYDPALLDRWSEALQNVAISAGSYAQVDVPDGAWVYCDPPYRDSFTSYNTTFGDAEQIALVEWCRRLATEKNCVVWLANRDAEDGFFDRHAPDAVHHRFPITYTAGRRKKTEDGFEAKPAVELLLVWDGRKG